ncbi:MAG: hypothetical protein ACHBN1_18515 [Heteroscytonema crispum UTEX LB 1556]
MVKGREVCSREDSPRIASRPKVGEPLRSWGLPKGRSGVFPTEATGEARSRCWLLVRSAVDRFPRLLQLLSRWVVGC